MDNEKLYAKITAIAKLYNDEIELYRAVYEDRQIREVKLQLRDNGDLVVPTAWLDLPIGAIEEQVNQICKQDEIVQRHNDLNLLKKLKEKYPEEFQNGQ